MHRQITNGSIMNNPTVSEQADSAFVLITRIENRTHWIREQRKSIQRDEDTQHKQVAEARKLVASMSEDDLAQTRTLLMQRGIQDPDWINEVLRKSDETMVPASREAGGKLVRRIWIEWAKEQPDHASSWLVPWEKLSEPDREVDRRVFEGVARNVLNGVYAECLAMRKELQGADLLAMDVMRVAECGYDATHPVSRRMQERVKAMIALAASKPIGYVPINWDDPDADGPVHNAARSITTILAHDTDIAALEYEDQVRFVLKWMSKAFGYAPADTDAPAYMPGQVTSGVPQ